MFEKHTHRALTLGAARLSARWRAYKRAGALLSALAHPTSFPRQKFVRIPMRTQLFFKVLGSPIRSRGASNQCGPGLPVWGFLTATGRSHELSGIVGPGAYPRSETVRKIIIFLEALPSAPLNGA